MRLQQGDEVGGVIFKHLHLIIFNKYSYSYSYKQVTRMTPSAPCVSTVLFAREAAARLGLERR